MKGRTGGDEDEPTQADLVAGALPEGFSRSVLTIGVGGSLPCSDLRWGDALVIVHRGALEIVTSDGARARFPSGAVLAVAELPASRLHNSGTEPVRLIAVRRSTGGRGAGQDSA